jgi:hypothetical protein
VASRGTTPGARKAWVVEFDEGAVRDFEDVKGRQERRAIFNVVSKLKELGPDLRDPHAKSLKGEADLFELRPRQGNSAVRPIYARLGERFVVLAVAPVKSGFGGALKDARRRLQERR